LCFLGEGVVRGDIALYFVSRPILGQERSMEQDKLFE
jgi:hypothetical protein